MQTVVYTVRQPWRSVGRTAEQKHGVLAFKWRIPWKRPQDIDISLSFVSLSSQEKSFRRKVWRVEEDGVYMGFLHIL